MRYVSFEQFWPYYVSEHRDPRSRALHFVGTSSFLAVLVGCLAVRPYPLVLVLAIVLAIGWAGFAMEARRNAAPVLLLMVVAMAAVQPAILLGVVTAYGCAWFAHFRIEHNRPATFTYPLWSLTGDFRMFGHMVMGRMWKGDGSDVAGPATPPAG